MHVQKVKGAQDFPLTLCLNSNHAIHEYLLYHFNKLFKHIDLKIRTHFKAK